MGMWCQKIMSLFTLGWRGVYEGVCEDDDAGEDVEKGYGAGPACFKPVPGYAIRQQRPLLSGKGSYKMYVIDYDKGGSPDDESMIENE